MARSNEDIKRQIKGLEEDLKHTSEIDLFGEPTHLIKKTQISILKGEKTLEDVQNDETLEEYFESVYNNAERVHEWQNERIKDDLFECLI